MVNLSKNSTFALELKNPKTPLLHNGELAVIFLIFSSDCKADCLAVPSLKFSMKNLLLLLLLVSGLTFTSCNDDEAMPDTPFITATVNGEAFTAAEITAVGDDTLGELVVFSSGTNAASDITIGLNIPETVEANQTYEVDAFDFGLTYGTDDEDASYLTVGSVTLSEFDADGQSMRGTFNFTATNSDDETDVVTVTGGEFYIEYMQ